MSKWALKESLELIRRIEPEAFNLHYNLSLGGGVLIKGESDHDLDIFCTPANGMFPTKETLDNFIKWLHTLDVNTKRIDGSNFYGGWWNPMMRKFAFRDKFDRKIDWFVVFDKTGQ